jgi:hypothetical protein
MNRRSSRRFLCADLVEARWRDRGGRLQRGVVNLEDISRYGACVQMDGPLARDTTVLVHCQGMDLPGTVRYCLYRDSSYFVGIEFVEGAQWSRLPYRPQHLLDPRELVLRASRRARIISKE